MGFFNKKNEIDTLETKDVSVNEAIVMVVQQAREMISDAKYRTGNALSCNNAQDCREMIRYACDFTKESDHPFDPSDYGFESERDLILGMMLYLSDQKLNN